MDWEQTAQEWVRAMRGHRSQVALSRRLGYRTNVLYAWEAGRDYPTAARFFFALARTGVDLGAGLARFYRGALPGPPVDLATAGGVAELLSTLRGGTKVVALAQRTGASRYAIARWLAGESEPRLPHFLALVEACTLRGIDLIAAFTDPSGMPSIARAHADLVAVREAAHQAPWTQAVLRCLELVDYQALPAHRPGWIAARIGIAPEQEAACLQLLEASGQVRLERGRYRAARVLSLDTRRDPRSTRALRAFWTREALLRLDAGSPDAIFSYNVFGVSERDYERLRELHAEYYQRMRALIEGSEPVERVVVASTQMVPLDAPPAKASKTSTRAGAPAIGGGHDRGRS